MPHMGLFLASPPPTIPFQKLKANFSHCFGGKRKKKPQSHRLSPPGACLWLLPGKGPCSKMGLCPAGVLFCPKPLPRVPGALPASWGAAVAQV